MPPENWHGGSALAGAAKATAATNTAVTHAL